MQQPFRHFFAIFQALFILGMAFPFLAAAEDLVLITGSNVRVRENPTTAAAQIGEADLFQSFRLLNAGGKEETIGGKTGRWHQLQFSPQATGWVFGAFAVVTPSEHLDDAILTAIVEKLKNSSIPLADAQNLVLAIAKKAADCPDRTVKAKLGLLRLHSLQKALDAYDLLPKNGGRERLAESAPTGSFFHRLSDLIIYNEPAGSHLVRAEALWKLFEEFKDTEFADDLAWEASQQILAGETEGYVPAVVAKSIRMDGEYLRVMPTGKHVGEAISGLGETLTYAVEQLADSRNAAFSPEEMSELQEHLKRIQALLDATTDPGKQKAEALLDKLRKH
jgi:hypothetical protein